jgi:dTMP kinase
MDSTRAYQGVLGDVDPALIRAIERIVVAQTRPDLTILLDLPASEGLRRVSTRGGALDRFESEGLAFHERLRQAFLAIAAGDPRRCVVIDADREPDMVATDVEATVRRRLMVPAKVTAS